MSIVSLTRVSLRESALGAVNVGREEQKEKQTSKEAGGKPLDRVSRPRTNPREAASGTRPAAFPRTYRREV